MKSPLRLMVLLALLAAFGAVPPAAAEPSGFLTFDWGTPRAVIEQTMTTQCDFSMTRPTLNGRLVLVCSGYNQMSNLGLGSVDVKLQFINDQSMEDSFEHLRFGPRLEFGAWSL